MAGATGGRSLEETPTWAVAVVCFILVVTSTVIEHVIHLIAKWLKKKQKTALYEALEKIKSELMQLGFISLLLTVGQSPISNICVSEKVGNSWHPCSKKDEGTSNNKRSTTNGHQKRHLFVLDSSEGHRRSLASSSSDKCAEKGKVPFISPDGVHQLHIFIFVLTLFHILYCVVTMALGRAKMKKWKTWEMETRTIEYQFAHDSERFQFTRDTSFGRRHLRFWTKNPCLIWIVCFFRQFFRSVPKVDYMTLRHGFIRAHLAPRSSDNFNFQKYIKRSLEEDFKVVVGISPPIWLFAVFFLLSQTHGSYNYLWLPFIPLIVILLVGTKLQLIITRMGMRIAARGEIVKGVPVVEPDDDLFWFNRPSLILYLINFVLFQNAFQLAFLAWSWYQFGVRSCFDEHLEDIIIRIAMGVLIQILCSYVTLPLYALVTQMGSSIKPTIFNDRVMNAIRNWHQTARRNIKNNRGSSIHSRATTSSCHSSPVHLLRRRQCETCSTQSSPRQSIADITEMDSPSSQINPQDTSTPEIQSFLPVDDDEQGSRQMAPMHEHEIEIGVVEFSFNKRVGV